MGGTIEEHADAVVVQSAAQPAASVVWLHGLGADGHDFVPLVPELRLPSSLALRFVFPHAPVCAVTINGGIPMRAWYDILALAPGAQEDVQGICAAAARVEVLIAAERAAGIAAERIVVAGFSQGGAVALHAALRHGESLAGVLALSTYLPLPARLAAEAASANRRVPILMCHGRQDPMVPVQFGELSRDALRAQGYAVEWRDYPMGHEVCVREIADLAAWLAARLGGGTAPARQAR